MSSTEATESTSRLHEIRQRGVIRVGVNWSPTAEQYIDPDTGEPAGIVPLLGNLLAKDLGGVEAEFVNLTWADHIPALMEDRVDICLKHTNTPQRALLVEFSRGEVLRFEGKVVIRRDRDIGSEIDLNKPDRVVACGEGESQIDQIKERYPRAKLRTFPTVHNALSAVDEGTVDACLADQAVPDFLRLHPECTVLVDENGDPVITSIDYAHPMIKAGDQRFLNWIDNWMDFHTRLGTIDNIIQEANEAFEAKFERIMGITEG